jgi:hypothetical protein
MKMSYHGLLAPSRIDSALKLHLLLLFYRHPRLCGEMRSLSEWLHEAPWDVEATLEALAELGILARIEDGEHIQYRLEPSFEHWLMLERLVTDYDDPQLCDQIHALIRAADQERRFRAWLVVEEGVPGEYELVV